MPPTETATPEAQTRVGASSVVLCGTFHRDLDVLRASFDQLQRAGCHILSPTDLEFVGDREGFVFTAHESAQTPLEIESRHLEAIARADFIWLHAPEGYVGPSAALEIGRAHALGVPVYSAFAPADVTLRDFVICVGSPAEAVVALSHESRAPFGGIAALQRYYVRVALARGYSSETPQDTLLLLTEELGELARAIRKDVGLVRHGRSDQPTDAALELADIQLYLVHMANVLEVDLAVAVEQKESINAERSRAVGAA